MKTVIIVQARMTSTRLPGKVLKKVLDKPLLEYQIERLKRVKLANEIVIATTTNSTDLPIVELCDRLSTTYFRGSEEDVLARYYGAAKEHDSDVVVRVTSDCPLIDPQVIDKVIQFYLDNQSQYDYVSNCLERTYPRGMDTEVFCFTALHEAFVEATAQPDREHVTPFICMHPERYRLAQVVYSENQSSHRWTVDTADDFELIKRIIKALYPKFPKFTLEDCLDLLKQHPDWSLINAHIKQKTMVNNSNFRTEQEHFWAGNFGDEYINRNQEYLSVASNISLFAKILSRTNSIQSIIEFGANIGLNLQAIKELIPRVKISAVEINQKAVEKLQLHNDYKVYHQSIIDFKPVYKYDLALVKGVLIHISLDMLAKVYELLYQVSDRYICIAEYYNPTPVEVNYRGHQGKLFKRDFAGEMLDKFDDLHLLDYGFVYHRDRQFPQDDVTWFLLEKTGLK